MYVLKINYEEGSVLINYSSDSEKDKNEFNLVDEWEEEEEEDSDDDDDEDEIEEESDESDDESDESDVESDDDEEILIWEFGIFIII